MQGNSPAVFCLKTFLDARSVVSWVNAIEGSDTRTVNDIVSTCVHEKIPSSVFQLRQQHKMPLTGYYLIFSWI